MKKRDYSTEANKLAKAIDIAIESLNKFPPKEMSSIDLEHTINVYADWKYSVLNPEPQFKRLVSLNYDIQNVFTYFLESTGNTINYFWKQIEENNLDYVRQDKLRKILDRGKIRGRIEYEYITDIIVVANQEGRTTEEETNKLAKMLSDFEKVTRKFEK